MSDFYKFEIANWNEGTANLTLEQEAAYLRIINAIRLSEQPITFNVFVLCGLWRCNERKARRILQELVDAGKVRVEGGKIINDKAVEDASTLRGLRVERASAGHRGGIESGKSRAKALENKETAEAIASTREEKRREEYSVSKDTAADAPPDPAKIAFSAGVQVLTSGGKSEAQARAIVGKWRKAHGDEAVIAALGKAQREGAVDPVAFCEGVFRRGIKLGPKPGERRQAPDGRWQSFDAFNGWVNEHV